MTQQAYHSQTSTQTPFVPFTPEERASFLAYRFGSTLDWSSRILVEINYPVEELRWFVDAVQGICRGKEQRIAHATLATRAQRFKNPAQAKVLAKRAITADREWSRLHRRMIFDIESPKPGEREGKDKRARTRYTDYLTPAAVWAQEAEGRAKKSDEVRWKKESKHRFAERQKILTEAVKMLPAFERVEDMPPTAQAKEPCPLSISEYVQQRRDRLLAENERVLARLSEGELIDANEIDDRIAVLEAYYNQVRGEIIKKFQSTRDVLEGLKLTRCVRAMNLGEVDEADQIADQIADEAPDENCATKGYTHVPLSTETANGKYSTKGYVGVPLSVPPSQPDSDTPKATGAPVTKGYAHVPLSGSPAEAASGEVEETVSTAPKQAVDEVPKTENEALTLQRALEYAAVEIAVFPLWGVSSGICDCPAGRECRSAGKHPLARFAKNGVKDATTDPAQIKTWFKAHPSANLAIAMGGALRLIALDSDPRNGGDASVCDLVEAHGDGWLETHTVRTGGNGNHFLYRLPEGVEVHKGKIAPGVDVKAAGGYLVAPPSVHASGRTYEVEKNIEIAVAPDWLIEELTRSPEVQPSTVINFQERRLKSTSEAARFFSGGERNDGLRDVACGRWTHGYATDAGDLYQQMREVRDTRCEFVPGDPPPDDAWLREMVQRTTQKFARGERATA
jgi:hypothetical protein